MNILESAFWMHCGKLTIGHQNKGWESSGKTGTQNQDNAGMNSEKGHRNGGE